MRVRRAAVDWRAHVRPNQTTQSIICRWQVMAACRVGSKLRVVSDDRTHVDASSPSRIPLRRLRAAMSYVMRIAEETVVDDCVRQPEVGPVRWYSVLRPTRCKWNVTCACFSCCCFMRRRRTWRPSNASITTHRAQQVFYQLIDRLLPVSAARRVGLPPASPMIVVHFPLTFPSDIFPPDNFPHSGHSPGC